MSLHGKEGDEQDAVREFCAAGDSFIYGSYHCQAESSFYVAWFA
jgi:hypothetical protein